MEAFTIVDMLCLQKNLTNLEKKKKYVNNIGYCDVSITIQKKKSFNSAKFRSVAASETLFSDNQLEAKRQDGGGRSQTFGRVNGKRS